ncbi:hypothetical protein EW145_g3030 [Phellinidium pouzarii]|uniref:Uncharacterized protein n=1 Tax=Phellinidium pouzarii TaxID=167371 RepID=A0A4S4L932_9AGAM|nr:hypothetical protein EW145_g3030 [Phellinidium pouzarii]
MALWGTGTLQLYLYYDVRPNFLCHLMVLSILTPHSIQRYWGSDKLWLRLYIIVIWALDAVHQAFIVRVAYTALVTHFADPLSVGDMDPTMALINSHVIDIKTDTITEHDTESYNVISIPSLSALYTSNLSYHAEVG